MGCQREAGERQCGRKAMSKSKSKSKVGSVRPLRWRLGVLLFTVALRGVARHGVPSHPWAVVARAWDLVGTPEFLWAQVFAGAQAAVAVCALTRDPLSSPWRVAAATLAAAGSPMAGLGLALVVTGGGFKGLDRGASPRETIGAVDGVKYFLGALHLVSVLSVAVMMYEGGMVGHGWGDLRWAVLHGGIPGMGEVAGVGAAALALVADRAGLQGTLGALVATPLVGPACVLCHALSHP